MKKKIREFRWDGATVKILEIIIDLFLIVLCFNLSVFIRGIFKGEPILLVVKDIFRWIARDVILSSPTEYIDSIYHFMHTFGNSVLYVLIYLIMSRIFECSAQKKDKSSILKSLFLAIFFTNIAVIVLGSLFPILSEYLLMSVYFYSMFGQFALIGLVKVYEVRFLNKKLIVSACVIGKEESAKLLFEKIMYTGSKRTKVKYIMFEETSSFEEMCEYVKNSEKLFIADDISSDLKDLLIQFCLAEKEIDVVLEPKMYEINMIKSNPVVVGDKLTYEITPLELSIEQRFLKRILDVSLALIGIVLTLPIMILVALAIVIEDKGPFIYSQERVTKNDKIFKIYKFRSMVVNAEAKTGAVLATKNDSRITKVGNFLRKTRLDELPQLFNVLKNDMSIVGPRPERREIIDKIVKSNDEFDFRINVKAGITGYAHVFGKYSTNHNDRLKMDLLYIRSQNFFFDLKIIFYTILTVITPDASEGLDESKTFEEKFGSDVEKVKDKNILMIKERNTNDN